MFAICLLAKKRLTLEETSAVPQGELQTTPAIFKSQVAPRHRQIFFVLPPFVHQTTASTSSGNRITSVRPVEKREFASTTDSNSTKKWHPPLFHIRLRPFAFVLAVHDIFIECTANVSN